MKILNYGSLNIDHVYQMPAFVKAGETLSATDCQLHTGGKGLNQSIALARAGGNVFHGGKIGADGKDLKAFLESAGVDCSYLRISDAAPTGHAIIQVIGSGENCILIYGGANRQITKEEIDETLSVFEQGDYLLLQNEISNVDYLIREGHKKGLKIVLNPSPVTDELLALPELALLDWIIVNQGEGVALVTGKLPEDGEEKNYSKNAVLDALETKYPGINIVLTLGRHGAVCRSGGKDYCCDTYEYGPRVDTTAAGDTFTGFFLASLSKGADISDCMVLASKAAGLSVTKAGAAESIPFLEEVLSRQPV